MSTEQTPHAPVNHVFVDLENIKTVDPVVFEKKNMTFHLILGPQNTKFDVEIVELLVKHADAVRIVRSPEKGKNAADFVLAYHLGQAALTEPKAHFHIVSKDTGFDSLVKFMKTRQVKVRRHDSWATLDLSAVVKAVPMVPAAEAIAKVPTSPAVQASAKAVRTGERPLSDEARKVLESLRKAVKNRPKMRATLVRHVQNGGGKDRDEKKAEQLVKELFSQGYLKDVGAGKLEYRV